jgi:hypothetical protein
MLGAGTLSDMAAWAVSDTAIALLKAVGLNDDSQFRGLTMIASVLALHKIEKPLTRRTREIRIIQ